MSLLEEIQTDAVDSSASLGQVLRKCKLLAARLGSSPLEEWLLNESNGYSSGVTVPPYRVWPLSLTGNFDGPFSSALRNYPIPLAVLPKKAKKSYETFECRQSVAALEELIASDPGTLNVSTGDLSLLLGSKVYVGYNCISVTANFSSGNVRELLNTVRNKVLDFAIALWKESPDAGEIGSSKQATLAPSHITQIFNTTIEGGGAATLVGSATNSQITSLLPHDFESLRAILKSKEVADEDVEELKQALQQDDEIDTTSTGPHVMTWVGKMMKKGAEGLWLAGASEGGKLLIDLLSKYHGH